MIEELEDDEDIYMFVEERFAANSEVDPLEILKEPPVSDGNAELHLILEIIFQLRDYDYSWLVSQFQRPALMLSHDSISSVIKRIFAITSDFERPFYGSQLVGSGVDIWRLELKSPIDNFAIGENFGDFRIVDRIGFGGLLLVYRGERFDGSSSVTVRTPRKLSSGSKATQIDAMRKEFLLLENLSSKEILGVQRQICWQETLFGPVSVCAFIEGTPLSTLTHSGMQVKEALRIIAEVGDILGQLHDHGTIHGDIKPENIIVAVDGSVHLIDFNVSVATGPNSTKLFPASGTPRYMGYEVLFDSLNQGSIRRDIYSLGATLFELVEGRPLIEPSSRGESLIGVVDASIGVADKYSKETPKSVRSIVAYATARDVCERFESCADFARACRSGIVVPDTEVKPDRNAQLTIWRLGRSVGKLKWKLRVQAPSLQERLVSTTIRGPMSERRLRLYEFAAFAEERNVVLLGNQLGVRLSSDSDNSYFRFVERCYTFASADYEQLRCRLEFLEKWIEETVSLCLAEVVRTDEQYSLWQLGLLIAEWEDAAPAEVLDSLLDNSYLRRLAPEIRQILKDPSMNFPGVRINAIEFLLTRWLCSKSRG